MPKTRLMSKYGPQLKRMTLLHFFLNMQEREIERERERERERGEEDCGGGC